MKACAALALVVLAAVQATAAAAQPARVAVGVRDGVPVEHVARLIENRIGARVDLGLKELGAVIVPVPDGASALPELGELPGVEYTEPIEPTRRLAFTPNDPLAETAQWYLGAIRAFDQWPSKPSFGSDVVVALIDSGIDASHPDLEGRVLAGKSFVGGRWDVDAIGHGTFVAGEIAAVADNGEGIAGVGLPVKLLVARVTNAQGLITVEAEAEAIKWAVDSGADIINLSLAGTRNPADPADDQYSELEQAAIEYAYERGAVLVAAAGNCPPAHPCPWRYAGYPAALPHVLGVGAIQADGSVAEFSNRDPVYVDIVAPGRGIVSTWPRALADDRCQHIGYSVCAVSPADRVGDGTSFAAPLVTAAIALLLAENPGLAPSQVMQIVREGARRRDLGQPGRDPGTGVGSLDVVELLAAAARGIPQADQWEANDDAGQRARRVPLRSSRSLFATIDYYDDPSDVYRVYLRQGRRVTISLTGSLGGKPTLVLWAPGTEYVSEVSQVAVRSGTVVAWKKAARPALRLTVERSGWYFVEVKAPVRGGGGYRLSIAHTRAKTR